MRNPLFKRIPKEIVSDWRKYLVIIVFMVVMIGVISGMYVGHDSMMFSVEESREKLHIEDGSFELSKKANEELLTSIATGEKANVRQFFIDKGMKKADRQVAKELEKALTENVKKVLEDEVRANCKAYGITEETLIKQQVDKTINEHLEDGIKKAKKSEASCMFVGKFLKI